MYYRKSDSERMFPHTEGEEEEEKEEEEEETHMCEETDAF